MTTRFDPDELRDLERRLTERLETIAPRPHAAAAAEVRARVAATPQRRGPAAWIAARRPQPRWRQVGAVGVVAVAALAVGIGVGSSGIFAVGKSPQPSASGVASVRPTATPSTLPRADIYQSWDRAELPDATGDPRTHPHGLVVFRDQLLVVGGVDTNPCVGAGCAPEGGAAVWRRTENGWARLPHQASFDAGAMDDAQATRDRLLVLGSTPNSPRGIGGGLFWPELWISTNGQTFSAYEAPANFTSIIAIDNGFAAFLASATTADGAGSEIWSSPDGRAWERIVDAQTLGPGVITTMRAGEFSYVAIGSSTYQPAEGDAVVTPTVWTSMGGQLWERHLVPQASDIRDVALTDGRLVAVGLKGLDGSAWISEDLGLTWREADPEPLRDHPLAEVIATPSGYLALGDHFAGAASVWTSVTGERWDPVPQMDEPASEELTGPLFAEPDGTVALIATHAPAATNAPSVWTSAPPVIAPALPDSPIFTDWNRVTLPDPAPDEYGGTIAAGIVQFKGRWIAVGFVNGGCCDGGYSPDTRGVIWTSPDGTRWTLQPAQDSLAEARIYSVAAGADRIVAVGAVDRQGEGGAIQTPATWESTDGTTWHLTAGTPSFAAVTVAGGTFVAASDADKHVAIYTSTDGRAWSSSISAIYPTADVVRVLGLAGRSDGTVVAVGFISTAGPSGEETKAYVWTTPDAEGSLNATSPADGALMRAVVPVGSGWRAVGYSQVGQQALSWTSKDGLSWSPSTVIEEGGDGAALSADVIVAAGADVVVTGAGHAAGDVGNLRAWVWTDGAWWGVPGASGPNGEIRSLVDDPAADRVIGVGNGPASAGSAHSAPFAWIAAR